MNNKGSALVLFMITGTIVVILLAYLFAPAVHNYTDTPQIEDTYNRTNNSIAQTTILSHIPVKSATVRDTVGNLLPAGNYTLALTNGSLTFKATQAAPGVYTVNYEYYPPAYIGNEYVGIFGIIFLAGLIGVIWYLFSGFGVA